MLYSFPYSYLLYIGMIGLCVGSFLNVVIVRIPKGLSLWFPASHCPQCKHPLRWRDNIPVFSYISLKGHCYSCQQMIPFRYPLVEIVTCVLSLLVGWRFGVSYEMAFALLLTWSLIALTFIDIELLVLPDSITIPMIGIGLILSGVSVFQSVSLVSSILGVLGGYLSLWFIYWGFKKVTGKEGMGFGDFKLLAMLGAWLGWQLLPFVLLFSSFTAAVFGIILILLKRQDRNTAIPFGPFLAAGGFLALLFGNVINLWYFGSING